MFPGVALIVEVLNLRSFRYKRGGFRENFYFAVIFFRFHACF